MFICSLCSSTVFCHTAILYIFRFFLPVTIFLSHSHSSPLPEPNAKYPPQITCCSLSHSLFQTVHIKMVMTVVEDGVPVDMCKSGRRGSTEVTYVLQKPQTQRDSQQDRKGWQCYRSCEVQRALVEIIFNCSSYLLKLEFCEYKES